MRAIRCFRWFLSLGLACLACTEARVDLPTDAGGAADTDDGGVTDGGVSDAGFVDDGQPDAGTPTVSVLTDLSLPGDPHLMDVYLPSNAERVVVFLHGGGGTKEGGAAREIGVRLENPPQATPVPDTVWLIANRTAFVFPQGQAISTAPRAR